MEPWSEQISLRKKFSYSELIWPVFSRIRTEYGEFECGKIRTRITPNMDNFHAVYCRINKTKTISTKLRNYRVLSYYLSYQVNIYQSSFKKIANHDASFKKIANHDASFKKIANHDASEKMMIILDINSHFFFLFSFMIC